MPPTITSVAVDPMILHPGQTDVYVDVTVTDDLGVTVVEAVAFDSSTASFVSDQITLALASGDSLNGTYNGTIVIPLSVSDGFYQIVILAANTMSDPNDYTSLDINDDSVITLTRGAEPPVPTPEDGSSETNAKGKCCCDVSININAGPVNIYVCGSDTNSQTDIPA
jgi:hypothetical protein